MAHHPPWSKTCFSWVSLLSFLVPLYTFLNPEARMFLFIHKSDHVILLQTLPWLLFPLRVKATPPPGDSGTPTASLLFSPMLTLLGNRHTADSGPLCFCSFCLECSSSSRYPYGSPLTSVWPLLKYHFLNEALPQAAYLNCNHTCSGPQHSRPQGPYHHVTYHILYFFTIYLCPLKQMLQEHRGFCPFRFLRLYPRPTMVPGIKLTLRKQPMNKQINIYISAPLNGAAGFQSQTYLQSPELESARATLHRSSSERL